MHLGFIGLGHLGRAIAGRLLERGHTLTVWNRTASRCEELEAERASSPAEVAQRCAIIFLCLFDSNAVDDVLSREDGILYGDLHDKVIVDLSTNHFRDAEWFHGLCASKGGHYFEAPVLGSVIPASQGTLTVLAGGSREVYLRLESLLLDIGNNLFHFEQPGLATRMKLVNNLVLGGFMAVLAEAFALGQAAGVDRDTVLEVLSAGAGNSAVLAAKRDMLAGDDFSAHFTAALMHKDLHFVQDLAYEVKQPICTGAAIKELYSRCFQEGLELEDFSTVYKLFRKI